jgi:CHAT domain-containing protein
MLPYRAFPCILLTSLTLLSARLAAETRTLADCQAELTVHPEARESAQCFFDVGAQGLTQDAERRVEDLLERNPRHPWLLFYLGSLRWAEPARAEQPFRAAASAHAARGDAEGEILARVALHSMLIKLGRPEEAAVEVQHVAAIARRSHNPLLIARSEILEAKHLRLRGENLERAYLLLHRAQEAAFPKAPFGLQRDCLEELAVVSHSLGRSAEERAVYRRLAELAQANGERRTEAVARYGALRTLTEELTEMPRPQGRAEATELAQEVLAAASAVDYSDLVGRAHLSLGRLSSGPEAKRHLEQCLASVVTAADRSLCLTARAAQERHNDLGAAEQSVQEALSLASQAKEPWSQIEAWRERMRLSWARLPREQALADSRSTLNVIEAIRDRQRGDMSRAGVASVWSEDYYWLSGRLLETGEAASLDEAFGVTERLRARTLLEALQAARAAPVGAPSPLQERHANLLEEIAQVQRRLLNPAFPANERSVALLELHRLEIEEADVRDRIAAADPARVSPQRADFAVLSEVRHALAADEALLSFQIAPDETLFGDFGGGSWLLVSTHGGTRAFRLRRDRVALRPAVAMFNGLFERRDGAEARPAAGLYRDLLEAALGSLPATVRKLIIVPDDVLHQLPFAALRRAPADPPLAARYEISIAPSATLWLHWRADRPATAAEPLLALADPDLPGEGARSPDRPVLERAAIFADGLQLGALPFARREGEAAVRHLDSGSLLRVGSEASEGFVKSADLRRFGILHFATHAVLDDQRPERSGVLLTPEPASEDGLLQMREIVPLHLDGRIVVLSSCRSASGQMLRGEGVMGLARAFFQAGAHTVVASLWPLRDDDGAALFDRFYAHLAQGRSVAEALRAAQRDRLAAGAPAYAWAGLVVLGDGDLTPLPGGRKGLGLPVWPAWAAFLAAMSGLILLSLALLAWRRRLAPPRKART